MVDTKHIEVLEGEILKEQKKIEQEEVKMLKKEDEIKNEVDQIEKSTQALNSIERYRHNVVKKLAKHKFVFSMIVSLGVVLIWRGIWDITAELPILKENFVALLVGFAIIWFLEKYSEVH